MDLRNFLKENNGLHFLKWVKIIQQESEAIKSTAMYILEKNQEYCEVIFVDDNGNKRKVTGVTIEMIKKEFALLDASNLTDSNFIQNWKDKLLPSNIATVDDLPNNVYGNVWSKQQSDALYMIVDEFVSNGKIMASKIEALGLTTVLKDPMPVETTIAQFATNSENYEFQDNDIIPIPSGGGNYTLYIFIGGNKSQVSNYLSMGLSNITIAMVQGLQAALDVKMDKPTAVGNYMARLASGSVTWRAINPAASYLTFWNGNDFTSSSLYYDGAKYGIGTTTPSEMLHLSNGRLRAKALVFDSNAETLSSQFTFDGTKFWGTSSSGIKRPFMYGDYNGELELWSNFTDAQRNNLKTIMNGGWTTATMSVAIVSPPVVDQTDRPFWINLKGSNLNLPPTSFKVELCTGDSVSADTATVVAVIPGSQVQLYTNGIDLTFYYNFKNIPVGQYKIRLWNGVAWYLTSFTLNVVAQINRVNLNNITWTRKIYNNTTSSVITESGASVSYNSDNNVKSFADDSTFIAARKTNELIGSDEDFYMMVEITGKTATISGANGWGTMTHFVGLVNATSTVDLLNQTVVNIRLVQSYWYPMGKFYTDNSTNSLTTADNTYGLTAIFMRRGGSWTIIITYNNQTLQYTKTGYTGAIAFGMYNQNTAGNTGCSANIVELYKF